MSYLFILNIEIEAKIEFGDHIKTLDAFCFFLEQDSRLFEMTFSSSIGSVDNIQVPYEKDHVVRINMSKDELTDQVLYSLIKTFEAKVQLLSLRLHLDFEFHFEIEPMVKQN